jgi:hypothetical protein
MSKNPVTYTSPETVYQGGKLIPPGEPFSTVDEPNDNWEKVSKVEVAAAVASDKTVHPDVNFDAMGVAELRAVAADKKVPFDGLSKKDLITAIKAADEPAL